MRYGIYLDTPVGQLYLEEENGALVCLTGSCEQNANLQGRTDSAGVLLRETPLLRETAGQVREFLAGRRTGFTVPIRLEGTDFQRRVWEALRRIPYGETRTYGQIAAQVGSPRGARAVGMACNRNPVMLIVPCHRVIGAGGRLVGFGGGLPMKEALLATEHAALRGKK